MPRSAERGNRIFIGMAVTTNGLLSNNVCKGDCKNWIAFIQLGMRTLAENTGVCELQIFFFFIFSSVVLLVVPSGFRLSCIRLGFKQKIILWQTFFSVTVISASAVSPLSIAVISIAVISATVSVAVISVVSVAVISAAVSVAVIPIVSVAVVSVTVISVSITVTVVISIVTVIAVSSVIISFSVLSQNKEEFMEMTEEEMANLPFK